MVDYTVSSELTLKDNVSEVLLKIGRALAKVNESVEKTQAGFDKLAGFGEMAASMEKLTAASRGLAESQAAIAKSAKESAAAMKTMAEAGMRARGGSGATAVAGARGAGRGHVNAMDVAIAGQIVGDAGMSMVEKAFMAEAQVQQLLNNLRMSNAIDASKAAEIRAKAEALTRAVPGTTIADNLHIIVDAFTAVGDIGEAMAGAEAMSRFNLVLKSLPGAHHGDAAFAAAQAVEVMQRLYDPKTHALDINAMNQQMAAMQQVALGTGGRVTPEMYLAFAKQARAGGMLANDQFLYRDLPATMIALGGSRAGTGEAATWRQFIQGRMTKNAFEELEKFGFIDRKATWSHGRVNDMEKHLAGAGQYIVNPVEWMRNVGFKLFKEHGVDPNDRKAMELAIGKFASTNVGLGFLSEIALGMAGINKEGGKIDNTTKDPMKALANDPMQKLREFQAAENEFMVTLGSALMGPAIDSLRGLTNVLHGMTDWSKDHPDAAKDIAAVGAGMAVLAKGASDLAMVIFIGSPLVRGITALGFAAEGALGPINLLLAAMLGIAKLGSNNETPENRQRLENLQKERRQNGPSPFGPTQDQGQSGIDDRTGLPFHKSMFQFGDLNIHLDGAVIYRNTMKRLMQDSQKPPSSTGSVDWRVSPVYPT